MTVPTVKVKPLVWEDFGGRGAKAQAWDRANYMIVKWSGDGRYEISASFPGYSTGIQGVERFHPTLEAAKAAAQADYEACILSAIDTTDATAALDRAKREARVEALWEAFVVANEFGWASEVTDAIEDLIAAEERGEGKP